MKNLEYDKASPEKNIFSKDQDFLQDCLYVSYSTF